MIVGYVRVSTVDQNTARQLDGVEVEKTFEDKVSGKDTARPALQTMIEFVREGDVIRVHSMDRLARNLEDLLRLIRELNAKGVAVEFIKEKLIFAGDSSPINTLLLQVMGAVAEFERSLTLDRQREGIAKAKAAGVYKGRKPALSADQATEVRQRAAAGEGKASLAREYGISRETLYSYLRTA